MKRRQLISSSLLAGAGSALLGSQLLASTDKDEHKHHKSHSSRKLPEELLETLSECKTAGLVCLNHCIEHLASGSSMLKDCAASVQDMLPVVEATHSMVSQGTASSKTMARLCIEVCEACEKECRKHKKMAECMACAEACEDCIAELKKFV